mmetsp:Transcript_63994/g.169425  ORF Transcript_63994/g.169425 Transcript_63994/m.169425 type:complete len:83 (-) Transcript_63994:760-1008(-)
MVCTLSPPVVQSGALLRRPLLKFSEPEGLTFGGLGSTRAGQGGTNNMDLRSEGRPEGAPEGTVNGGHPLCRLRVKAGNGSSL